VTTQGEYRDRGPEGVREEKTGRIKQARHRRVGDNSRQT
jgi:hypothetical protein